jgi:hypothetical protein
MVIAKSAEFRLRAEDPAPHLVVERPAGVGQHLAMLGVGPQRVAVPRPQPCSRRHRRPRPCFLTGPLVLVGEGLRRVRCAERRLWQRWPVPAVSLWQRPRAGRARPR